MNNIYLIYSNEFILGCGFAYIEYFKNTETCWTSFLSRRRCTGGRKGGDKVGGVKGVRKGNEERRGMGKGRGREGEKRQGWKKKGWNDGRRDKEREREKDLTFLSFFFTIIEIFVQLINYVFRGFKRTHYVLLIQGPKCLPSSVSFSFWLNVRKQEEKEEEKIDDSEKEE